MANVFDDQAAFMTACGQHTKKMCYDTTEQVMMYGNLIVEEGTELEQSIIDNDLVAEADALIDMIVVIIGRGFSRGFPMQPLWDEVLRSNMSKVMPDGTVHRRADGKVLKPDTYSPPDIAGVLRKYGFDV